MSRATLDLTRSLLFSNTGLSPSVAGLSRTVLLIYESLCCKSEPRCINTPVWALSLSLAATQEITCCFLFLRLLRCFSSPGSPCMTMYSSCSDWRLSSRVSPFRHFRIKGYLLLPETFRSLSRLSSALSAQASTLCSFSHDQSYSCQSPDFRTPST